MQDAEITKSLCKCNSKDWFTCKSENKVTWSKEDTEIGSIALSYCLKFCVKELWLQNIKGTWSNQWVGFNTCVFFSQLVVIIIITNSNCYV